MILAIDECSSYLNIYAYSCPCEHSFFIFMSYILVILACFTCKIIFDARLTIQDTWIKVGAKKEKVG